MNSLFQDINFGLRTLFKSPGFAAIAIGTLALGIGANSAMFSIINSLLIRPYGYTDANELVCLYSSNPTLLTGSPDATWDRFNVSANDFVDWEAQSRSFAGMGICRSAGYNLTGGDRPERVTAVHASAGLLPLLGVEPLLGRLYTEAEDQPGRGRVALLAESFWRQRFGGDLDIIGRAIHLDGESYTVLAVLPRRFERSWGRFSPAWDRFDLWAPFAFDETVSHRGNRSYRALARLRPGVGVARAKAEMESVGSRLAALHPVTNRNCTVNVVALHDAMIGDAAKPILFPLGAAVVFVLLIACANVANLLLARGQARQKEFAVRSALGASGWRILRQILAECLVLAMIGGGLGILLAIWGIDALVAVLPDTLPRVHEISVDQSALIFTVLLSLLAAVIFGLVPAIRSSALNLASTLKASTRSASADRNARRGRDLLVASQVALALALVVCAGLMIKSFIHLRGVDPGFNPKHLLTMRVDLPFGTYDTPAKRVSYFGQVAEAIRTDPAIPRAAAVSSIPLDQLDTWEHITVEEFSAPDPQSGIFLGKVTVTPGYFETMGIPILDGRDFTQHDNMDGRPVVIVSEATARRFWPDKDPIGRRIKTGGYVSNAPWRTVVGVVGNVKQRGLRGGSRLETYRPFARHPVKSMSIVVRTAGDPTAAIPAVQSAVWKVDPQQALYRVRSMDELVFDDIGVWGVVAAMFSVFAIVALLLASVGLYGVISYSVSQRGHEIGIRMAMGARTGQVLRLVLRQAVGVTLLGEAAGIVLALLLGRLLHSLTFGVSASDPMTLIEVSLLLLGVALLASYLPARRATRVNPVVALRDE